MKKNEAQATRGYGLLENYLSKKRAEIANRFIAKFKKNGRILDVGCGHSPIFLRSVDFSRKIGIDKHITNRTFRKEHMQLKRWDIEKTGRIPFKRNSFECVSMLAVIEHVDERTGLIFLKESHRVLKNNGILIITTPPPWSNALLKVMAKVYLVSPEEIHEHKQAHTVSSLKKEIVKAGFPGRKVKGGYFELGMNLWVIAKK